MLERNIVPWFDERELRPGTVWQRELEAQLQRARSVAVILGASGIGP